MDLIDRAALIESMGLENAVKWGNKDGYQQAHSYSTMMLYEIKNDIDAQPTIEAVPLDQLCEFLEKCGADSYCGTCKQIMGECFTNGRECGSAHFWKELLTKWVEGLDAAD